MKRFFTLCLVIPISTIFLSGNGLNLNSNGAKAVAMGGAFIGLADDYSAVFWNPAGLIQLKQTTLSFYMADVLPTATYTMALAGIDTQTDSKHYFSGSVGFFKPIANSHVVFGIYGYVPSGIGAKWDGSALLNLTRSGPYVWESMLGVITVSPALAVQISDHFSFGASVNVNYGMLTMKRPVISQGRGLGQYEEDMTGLAVGFTIGAMFKASEKFSFGATIKTPFAVKLSGDAKMSGAPALGLPGESKAEREASWPLWVGVGMAFHASERLTFTADAQYSNWKAMTDIPISYDNSAWEATFAPGSRFELQWQDAVQLRVGIEYLVSGALALRAGYYYDPSPSPHRTTNDTHNILLPQLSYHWITGGIGYRKGNLTVDATLEYGMGQDITIGSTEVHATSGMPGTHGMTILMPCVSVSIGL